MIANNSVKKCYYCGKKGHVQNVCFKKQADDAKRKQASAKHKGYFVEEDKSSSHEFRLFIVNYGLSASDEDDISYVDSRASSHMTGKKEFFDILEESTYGSKIYLGDDSGYNIKGYGVILVKLPNGKISHLKFFLYVPGIKKNLISVSMITDQDMQVEFFKTHCVIKDCRKEIVATSVRVGSLYRLDVKSISKQAMVAGGSTVEQLWHQIFGHLKLQDLMLLQRKGMVEGLPMFRNIQLNCDGCALDKMHREQFPVHDRRKETNILELVHTDICGPMQTRSLGGAYYFLLFTDDCTRYSWVYFLSKKSQTFQCFIEFKTLVEKQFGKSIKILRSHQGGEYKLGEFMKLCKSHGIVHQFTVPHTPQQNGVVERKSRTLVECARSMLQGKDLSNSFGQKLLILLYI